MTTRNLAERTTDGLHISLDWSPSDNTVWLSVEDVRDGYSFPSECIPADEALQAFNHPFVYVEDTTNPEVSSNARA